MIATVQNVIKNITKVTLKNAPLKLARYIFLLMLSKERKNFASMARENNFSYKQVYISNNHLPNYIKDCKDFLCETIKSLSTKDNPGRLLIDFTVIWKQFSEHIPGVTYDYNGTTKQVTKGFSTGFVVWTNGKIVIPFDYALWIRKKDLKDAANGYKTKTEIAK